MKILPKNNKKTVKSQNSALKPSKTRKKVGSTKKSTPAAKTSYKQTGAVGFSKNAKKTTAKSKSPRKVKAITLYYDI